ncbi:hypothetical protein RIR_jg12275.t1 [Rhizophagus irregularis DAOM 181602=DAOM 197198]|nr:hypothetical protein RIR_jg12275.t1 [Rhizophagus irregularis DAOM 181602=DAOM 197198]
MITCLNYIILFFPNDYHLSSSPLFLSSYLPSSSLVSPLNLFLPLINFITTKMSDSEFMSSDDEIFDEAFDNDFIENIPNDSDSDGEDNGGSSNETLKLEVGMAFLTWKIAFNHVKQ